ncbi:MAG: class A beta-lactamase-related serine hydrolase [Chitinophagaceae bacterium]|nr:MAG: class A beta-lactamase-related serine hydrolase [Chitinophagaceae bacterium]
MKHPFTLFLLLACLSGAAQYQTIRKLNGSRISPVEADSLVSRLMLKAKVTGMNIAVLNDNEVVYQKSFGYSEAAGQRALDTADVMYAASFSKAVFGYINMQLAERNLIDPDKPLYQYLKKSLAEYGPYEELEKDPRWKQITARMCLSHTTGMPNIWFLHPRTGVVDTTLSIRLYFDPGTKYAYSGEGLKLLQRVEEILLGKNLETLAEEMVFRPAGMIRSSYIWKDEFEKYSASGHDEQGQPSGKQRAGKPGAAGSMSTTVGDYARFIRFVLTGQGLTGMYYKEMITPQVRINSKVQFPTITDDTTSRDRTVALSYGLGWGVLDTPYGRAFFKEGHHDYWRNYNINFPDSKTAIVIMSNSANAESIFKELLEGIIGDTFTVWEWENYIPLPGP